MRKELETKGHKFITNGDTEVLLQGYVQYKEKILDKIRGQFAFVIYDNITSDLFMARDRIGIKPLYYSANDDWILFGSEIKAIESSKLVKFEPDIDSYLAYLRHLCVPADRTGNKNIKKLEPGQFIQIDKNGKTSKNIYWDPFSFSVNQDLNEKTVTKELDRLLNESVEYRKVSDVEVGLLSFGRFRFTFRQINGTKFASSLKAFNVDFEENFEGYKGELKEARYASKEIE